MWAAASQAHGPVPAGTTVPDCPSRTDRVGPSPSFMFNQRWGCKQTLILVISAVFPERGWASLRRTGGYGSWEAGATGQGPSPLQP